MPAQRKQIMTTRLKSLFWLLLLALMLPAHAYAQQLTNASSEINVGKNLDAVQDEKSWGVGALASFDIGIGAFTKHEYARKIRSRFAFSVFGNYVIPVIDVDIHAETGFSQWMSKAGGTNGKHEFRWADSSIGLSREIWSYKSGDHSLSFDFGLDFVIPTSKVSLNEKLYTTIVPSLSFSYSLANFSIYYSIEYGHSFNKYTSTALKSSEVDVLSRSTGVELLGSNAVAIDGLLTEIELVNQFKLTYRFIKQLSLSVGFGFLDSWTYDNGTVTAEDEFTNPNAHVGRGHYQRSLGSIALNYRPIKYLDLNLSLASSQPWKTADNKTIRFPWYDTISPSKNYTKLILSVMFHY